MEGAGLLQVIRAGRVEAAGHVPTADHVKVKSAGRIGVARYLEAARQVRAAVAVVDNFKAVLSYDNGQGSVQAVGFVNLNEGISDDRDKVVFHSLRHTFCSWLVEEGIDLYTVKELAGYKTLSMTARYCHLGNGILQNAVRKLHESM